MIPQSSWGVSHLVTKDNNVISFLFIADSYTFQYLCPKNGNSKILQHE